MFSSQSIDYSLSVPTRCLASLPARSSSPAAQSNSDPTADEEGWGDDDSFNFEDANNEDTHRFLVGTSQPSISKPDNDENAFANGEEENNALHLLSYHEDSHEVTLDASYPHPTGEVWAVTPHPKNGTVVTCGGGVFLSEPGEDENVKGNKLMEFKTQLWKMSNGDDEDFGLSSGPTLEPLITIPHGENESSGSGWGKRVGCILWNPSLYSDDISFEEQQMTASLLTVGWESSSPISLWDLSASVAVETWSLNAMAKKDRKRNYNIQTALPRRASWNPHEPTTILCTERQDVVAYDMRIAANCDGIGAIRNAHRYGVSSVDHNRLQEHVVVTSGLDGTIKFWDLRMHLTSKENSLKPTRLLKSVCGGHSHWATRVSYNPFYDQLVVSGGSDGLANLWRISSCSSAPLLDFDGDEDVIVNNSEDAGDENENKEVVVDDPAEEDQEQTKIEGKKTSSSAKPSANDVRISRFECSDTSADVCWSASDPWMYATLSCDGAFVVHHVPSKEKYKILL